MLTSYLVSNAVVLPISGWLSTRVGRKRFYMTCVALFTISSFLCGMAPIARAAHLLPHPAGHRRRRPGPERAGHPGRHVPARQARHGHGRVRHGGRARARDRAHARGASSPTTSRGAGSSSSTCRSASRRSSSPTASSPTRRTSRRRTRTRPRSVDWSGLGLIAAGLGCARVVLDKGQEDDWFHSSSIVGFSDRRRRLAHLVRALGARSTTTPSSTSRCSSGEASPSPTPLMLVLGVALFGSTVLLPQYLQVLMGYTAQQSGMALSPGGFAVIAALASRGPPRVEGRRAGAHHVRVRQPEPARSSTWPTSSTCRWISVPPSCCARSR